MGKRMVVMRWGQVERQKASLCYHRAAFARGRWRRSSPCFRSSVFRDDEIFERGTSDSGRLQVGSTRERLAYSNTEQSNEDDHLEIESREQQLEWTVYNDPCRVHAKQPIGKQSLPQSLLSVTFAMQHFAEQSSRDSSEKARSDQVA